MSDFSNIDIRVTLARLKREYEQERQAKYGLGTQVDEFEKCETRTESA